MTSCWRARSDHISLWCGSLIKFRREFDQYINLRPVRLFDGVPWPLAGRKAGDIDYLVVRENTEGEYTALGGVTLSDLGPATTGTIGLAPSASLNPERLFRSLFESLHGSRHCRQEHREPDRDDLVGQRLDHRTRPRDRRAGRRRMNETVMPPTP